MRLFPRILFTAISLLVFSAPAAAQFTILPSTDLSSEDCEIILSQYEVDGKIQNAEQVKASQEYEKASNDYSASVKALDIATFGDCMSGSSSVSDECGDIKKKEQAKDNAEKKAESLAGNTQGNERDNLLACAIKTGKISLQMVPYFITYIANFLLAMIGIICILFIVLGGYYYIYGGLVDKKEKGKLTIIHALMGMGIALLAWVAVNAIITAVTS